MEQKNNNRQRRIDVLGLGYCGMDYSCLLPCIPQDDKVQIITASVQGGGPAATAACTAAKLGAAAAFAGVVGDDSRGREILQAFGAAGVDTAAVAVRKNGESPSAFCWTEAGTGKRSIAWTSGSVTPLEPAELPAGLVESAALLHLDGHQTAAAIHAAKIARRSGTMVSLDAGTVVPGIEELLELADVVIASEKFAGRVTGVTDPREAARKLFGRHCRFAGVTAGEKGSFGFDGRTDWVQPAFKVRVVDTTGAGDVYHGAFACRLVRGGSWAECMAFAAAVAALKCTVFGGRRGIPDQATATRFITEQASHA